jgi:hypothetical protein
MAPGDFKSNAGKQRAVWVQSGGSILVGNATEHFDVIVLEAGTAVREDFWMFNDDIQRGKLRIPIMVLPAGASVVKTVAMAAPAAIHWDDDADLGELERRRGASRRRSDVPSTLDHRRSCRRR